MIDLDIPVKPLSLNHAYSNGRRGRFATQALRDYHAKIAMHALVARRETGAQMLTGPAEVRVAFFFDSDRPDLDNHFKPFLDGLTGARVWKNDRQVVRIYGERHVTPGESRIFAKVRADAGNPWDRIGELERRVAELEAKLAERAA